MVPFPNGWWGVALGREEKRIGAAHETAIAESSTSIGQA